MDQVTLGAHASIPLKTVQYHEGLDLSLLENLQALIWGGTQHVVGLALQQPDHLEHWLPQSAPIAGNRVKWLLLSPAVFPGARSPADSVRSVLSGSWLPDWICPDTGRVLLRNGDTRRGHRSREDWRRHIRQLKPFECRLVGISLPEMFEVGGWTNYRHRVIEEPTLRPGPRARWQAVPAGTVYYFEGADAPQLAEALAWHGQAGQNPNRIQHRRSTLLGEQGFGLGVCGPW
jgi:hypothetical protein